MDPNSYKILDKMREGRGTLRKEVFRHKCIRKFSFISD